MEEKIIKSAQKQTIAAWIDLLNKIRIDEIVSKLESQEIKYADAMDIFAELKRSIADDIVYKNRGGEKGIHGFIGERLQVYIENAKSVALGKVKEYKLIDDNGAVDYLRGNTPIQQKARMLFCSLTSIREHSDTYIHFVENGGIYQVPKDFYCRIEKLWELSEEKILQLKESNKEDYLLYKYINVFREKTNITIDQIEPMDFTYEEIQKINYEKTIAYREKEIKDENDKIKKQIAKNQQGSLKELGKVTLVSAGIEGGMNFILSVKKKMSEGKSINEFTEQDWKEVGIDTGKATLKGGIRGASVYLFTNMTLTPANVASAYVTAAFNIASQMKQLKNNNISEEEFLINCEIACLDVVISSTASMIGQTLIPIPALGAVIGNITGEFLYKLWRDVDEKETNALIDVHRTEVELLNKQLDEKYLKFILELKEKFNEFNDIEKLAFDKNVNIAFERSIELAIYIGVPYEKILKNNNERDNYFLS